MDFCRYSRCGIYDMNYEFVGMRKCCTARAYTKN